MEDSTRKSRDGKLKIVIDEASNNTTTNSNNSYVPVVVTTDDNSEIVMDAAAAAVKEPSESENEGDDSDELFKPQIIPKVSLMMRNHKNNKGVFDPKVVSIGPYHHGKEELQFVENLKPMVAKQFILDSASGKNIDEFYNKVLKKVAYFRRYYVEGSTDKYTPQQFANMMLLDGCFILGIIESYFFKTLDNKSAYDDVLTQLGFLVWSSSFGDIFNLLENQLPFQVLELLMSLKFKDNDDEGMKRIHAYLNFKVSTDIRYIQNKKEVEVSNTDCRQPLHLLQLQRAKYINQPLHIFNSQRRRCTKKVKFQRNCRPNYYIHLFELCLKYFIRCLLFPFVKKNKSLRKYYFKDVVYRFRSVTELKAKGIYFRPASSLSLNAIKFKSYCFYGRLKLPPFLVGQNTKPLFSNMIAYELCLGNTDDIVVTSYVGFLKSLIDQPGDVKELRSKHILFNVLGSDEEVTNVFKEITTFSVGDFHMYNDVKQSIQNHFNSTAKTWMAEFLHVYFSRPWAVIALIAAASLLVAAILQTVFTISPRSDHTCHRSVFMKAIDRFSSFLSC